LRRLGVGGSGGGGERPLRAQLVVALIVGLVLLAVPLYLWRRPSGTENAPADAAAADRDATSAFDAGAAGLLDGAANERFKLAPVQRVKCSAGPGARGQEGSLCDQLPIFEQALAKAIKDSVDCAPKSNKEGTINYVLSVDFAKKRLHVFPGASGSWRGPQARRAAKCVLGSLPAPAWGSIQHQYRFYQIAILTTYVPASAKPPAPGGTSAPLFE
jgi:hypothetical protein